MSTHPSNRMNVRPSRRESRMKADPRPQVLIEKKGIARFVHYGHGYHWLRRSPTSRAARPALLRGSGGEMEAMAESGKAGLREHGASASGSGPSERLGDEEALAVGRAQRKTVPRSAHGGWRPQPDRLDPIDLLRSQDANRLPDLVPVRMDANLPLRRGSDALEPSHWRLGARAEPFARLLLAVFARSPVRPMYGSPSSTRRFVTGAVSRPNASSRPHRPGIPSSCT